MSTRLPSVSHGSPIFGRADQFFNMGCLLGRQLYCHPRKTLAIQGWQHNCHPNAVEN
jgi:hypothetical protein